MTTIERIARLEAHMDALNLRIIACADFSDALKGRLNDHETRVAELERQLVAKQKMIDKLLHQLREVRDLADSEMFYPHPESTP